MHKSTPQYFARVFLATSCPILDTTHANPGHRFWFRINLPSLPSRWIGFGSRIALTVLLSPPPMALRLKIPTAQTGATRRNGGLLSRDPVIRFALLGFLFVSLLVIGVFSYWYVKYDRII